MKERRYGRRYDAQFKEQAVQLLLTSGKTVHQIARELGSSCSNKIRSVRA